MTKSVTEPTRPPVAPVGTSLEAATAPGVEPAADAGADGAAQGDGQKKGQGRRRGHGRRRGPGGGEQPQPGVNPEDAPDADALLKRQAEEAAKSGDGVDAQPGADTDGKKKRRRNRRGPKGERQPQPPKDPVLDQARLVYASVSGALEGVLYSSATERPGDDGKMEDIPEDEWSYASAVRAIAEAKLDFNYNVEPPKWYLAQQKHGKGPERPYKEVKAEQTADDHEIARKNIVWLVTERFDDDMKRVDAAIDTARTKANADGKGAEVLKVRQGEDGTGPSLEQFLVKHLVKHKLGLEWLRVETIRNAMDWFDKRVSQVETAMHTLTRRKEKPESVEQRLSALTKDPDFTGQLENLQDDLKMFESFLVLPFTPGSEPQQAEIKRLVVQAKQKVTYFEGQKAKLLKLNKKEKKVRQEDGTDQWVGDEKEGKTQIERAKSAVLFDLNDSPIAAKFIEESERRMVGLSPEQELNYWQAVKELFSEYSDDIPSGGSYQIRAERRAAKLVQINEALHLFAVERGVGTLSNTEYLVNIDDRTNPREKTPNGFGQVVEKCIAEAKLAIDYKQKLFITMVTMGFDTKRATQILLRGYSNQEKLDAIGRLNPELINKQSKAFAELTALKIETKEMDDAAKAALVIANAPAQAFRTELAGRTLKTLRWNRKEEPKDADRAVITKIRLKAFELMGMKGDLKDDDIAKLEAMLFPPAPEAKVVPGAVVAPEGEPAKPAEPLVIQIAEGRLPAELFVGTPDGTAETLRDRTRLIMKRLGVALQAGVVNETMTKQFAALQPTKPKLDGVVAFVDAIERIVNTCEQCKKIFGDAWTKLFDLRQVDPSGNQRGLGNTDFVSNMLNEINEGVGPTEAMFRAGGDTVLKAALTKAGAGDVVIPDDRKDDVLVRLSNAVVDGEFNKVNKTMVEGWLLDEEEDDTDAGEEGGAAEEDAEVATAKLPTERILQGLLDGQIDQAAVFEAYPHQDGKEDVTVDIVKAYMVKHLQSIVDAVGTEAMREPFIKALDFAIGLELSDADTLQIVKEKIALVDKAFVSMKETFGPEWASDCGLVSTSEGDTLVVDQAWLEIAMGDLFESDDVIGAFKFTGHSGVPEKLLNRLDADSRAKLDEFQISPDDQLYIALLPLRNTAEDEKTILTPAVALRRLGKYLALFNPTLRGEDLLVKHKLMKKTADGSQYQIAKIKGTIMDEALDDAA